MKSQGKAKDTVNWQSDPELQIKIVKLKSIDTSCVISLPNLMFNLLLESIQWDDSNKWSNIRFGEELGIIDIKIRTLSGALSIMPISSPNPMFDHLLESSHWNDSTKWSNIGFGLEIMQAISIEITLRILPGALITADNR